MLNFSLEKFDQDHLSVNNLSHRKENNDLKNDGLKDPKLSKLFKRREILKKNDN
jgi:hypothetical protein